MVVQSDTRKVAQSTNISYPSTKGVKDTHSLEKLNLFWKVLS